MKALDGIVVVTIEQALPVPFRRARLADAVACAIKIERPEGDSARCYDAAANGQSSYFVWRNRGNESVLLDLSKKDDRARLEELPKSTEVMVQNLKPVHSAVSSFRSNGCKLNDPNTFSKHPHLQRISVDTPPDTVAYPVPGVTFGREHCAGKACPELARKRNTSSASSRSEMSREQRSR